jgi:hypothetical protein
MFVYPVSNLTLTWCPSSINHLLTSCHKRRTKDFGIENNFFSVVANVISWIYKISISHITDSDSLSFDHYDNTPYSKDRILKSVDKSIITLYNCSQENGVDNWRGLKIIGSCMVFYFIKGTF